jgi:hypothetical protein
MRFFPITTLIPASEPDSLGQTISHYCPVVRIIGVPVPMAILTHFGARRLASQVIDTAAIVA